MLFSSLSFLFTFLPLYFILYTAFPKNSMKNAVLLVFSIIFYTYGEPIYVLLMIISVAVNYCLALFCAPPDECRYFGRTNPVFEGLLYIKKNFKGTGHTKAALAIAAVFNIAMLTVFKYSGFLVTSVNGIFDLAIPIPGLRLPLGISFYTFQMLTYVVDVYRRDADLQPAFYKLLTYISCFHQLVAGPIVRYKDIAAEIDQRSVSRQDVVEGITRFTVGLGKKVLLANAAGALAAQYMGADDMTKLPVLGAWLGIAMYTVQIYLDFSAYSDMAIGLGRMIGFHYRENFNYPYTARSITDFWRRWHISLSGFFRDYVYIPLGGNRKHHIFNLFIVWLLTGLWHGASVNFILWGLYYFVLLVFEKYVLARVPERITKAVPRLLKTAVTVIFVAAGWIIFYYTDISEMGTFVSALFGRLGNAAVTPQLWITLKNNAWLIFAAVLACTPIVPLLRRGVQRLATVAGHPDAEEVIVRVAEMVTNAVIIVLCVAALVGQSYNPFLYFRF